MGERPENIKETEISCQTNHQPPLSSYILFYCDGGWWARSAWSGSQRQGKGNVFERFRDCAVSMRSGLWAQPSAAALSVSHLSKTYVPTACAPFMTGQYIKEKGIPVMARSSWFFFLFLLVLAGWFLVHSCQAKTEKGKKKGTLTPSHRLRLLSPAACYSYRII